MQIEFVNHASLIFSHGGVRLLCDPWLHGTSFNDSWALLSETRFGAADFERVTHIWYSHEHPDHFSPRCLGMVPKERRGEIEILFHESEDKKVVRYCEKQGFRTRELPADTPVELAPGFVIRCARWDHSDDSWLWVEAGGQRALNLNDCLVNSREEMEGLRGRLGPVDVLLTQFSIAGWNGNPGEFERRKAGARNMLERTVLQSRVFEPRALVPFASFVWFCHEENDYMNDVSNRVGDVAAAVEAGGGTPVVLYPGDAWNVEEPWDNAASLAQYQADYDSLAHRERFRSETVPIQELQEAADRFRHRVNGEISDFRLRLRMARMNARYQQAVRPGPAGKLVSLIQLGLLHTEPARIWLNDLDRAVRFDLQRGLLPLDARRDACQIALSTDSLAYAFRFLWGGLALQINGRFEELEPEGRLPLFDALWMADGLNREEGAEARPL